MQQLHLVQPSLPPGRVDLCKNGGPDLGILDELVNVLLVGRVEVFAGDEGVEVGVVLGWVRGGVGKRKREREIRFELVVRGEEEEKIRTATTTAMG